jgi:uncharacterized DUF497 family protein
MEFEWDPGKNEANIRKHGIDFEDAIGIFAGPILTRRSDREGEERWVAIGAVEGREVAMVYTIRGAALRIISARRARRNERRDYRQAHPGE